MFLLCSSHDIDDNRREKKMLARGLDREGALVLAIGWIVALMVTLT
jgi:hypothetical protein